MRQPQLYQFLSDIEGAKVILPIRARQQRNLKATIDKTVCTQQKEKITQDFLEVINVKSGQQM